MALHGSQEGSAPLKKQLVAAFVAKGSAIWQATHLVCHHAAVRQQLHGGFLVLIDKH